MKTATAQIDLAALRQNFTQIKQMVAGSQVLAVLKANAYGHGLVKVAEQLKDADAFGVARIEEALALRTGGIVKPIVLLEGFLSADDLPILVANNIEAVVHINEQVQLIEQATLSAPIKIWLKVDTGMHRLGLMPDEFISAYQRLRDSQNVKPQMCLMSHFACADEQENPMNECQIALFDEVVSAIEGEHCCEHSLANSAALIALPQARRDWVRPGLLLYGVSPIANVDVQSLSLKPVMTFKSSLIAIRKHYKGGSIGYGAAWTAKEDTYIGVVAIGYGDGYPRSAPCGTPVLVNGRMVKMVGRVSMDMITVDLGANPQEQLGDEVTLWGKGLRVEYIAELCGTISYELLCNVTQRVKYCYLT